MADIRQRTVSILPSVERIQEELARANSIDDRLLIQVAHFEHQQIRLMTIEKVRTLLGDLQSMLAWSCTTQPGLAAKFPYQRDQFR